ncbi:Ni/Fe-hydrogenase b-type cytochrome subunit [Salmonella enterica]|nr:Ni/Fe-hydrogenase b-type cytochrome subunit [Salmonella enterica]
MTGKLSPRVGEARDTAVSHYVFEAPVRLWHWLTVACMLVLMVTGYFIGRPLPSVSGEATYLFYMGYIRLIHFAAAMIFTVLLLGRIYWACVGNRYSRELFIVPVWRRSWWQGAFSVVRWYLFLEKKPGSDIGHNPVAQAAMFGYFLLSVFMILIGFALFGEHSQYAIFAPFRYVVEFFYWTGGNSIDIHSWHRLGMWLIAAFIVGHVYLAIREDIMSDDTVISTMINGYRSHKFPKPHDKEPS